MANSQSRKRKRELPMNSVSNYIDAIQQPGRHNTIPRSQTQSKALYKPRGKSVKAQLPRPKRPVTFSLPEHLNSLLPTDTTVPSALKPSSRLAKSRSSTSNNTSANTTDTQYIRLLKTQLLLTRIQHRNKNQHRAQPFFKHLNLLRRALSRLIRFLEPSDRPPQPSLSTSRSAATKKHLSASTSTKPAPLSAEQTRLSFERQAELRSQREALESWIRETLVPGCYMAFSSLIADTQFANLGVMLMGCLVDVVGEVGLMKTVERFPAPVMKQAHKRVENHKAGVAVVEGWSTMVTGPDVGVVVRRLYEENDYSMGESSRDDLGVVVERERGASPREEHASLSSDTLLGESTPHASKRDQISRKAVDSILEPSSTNITNQSGFVQTPAPAHLDDPTPQRGHATFKPNRSPNLQAQIPVANNVKPKLDTGAAPHSRQNDNTPTDTRAQHQDSKRSKSRQNQIKTSAESIQSETQGTEKKSKKKKKKGNAIDELFSGF